MSEVFDITIVGGGPVGLFAAFYAGQREKKTKIIDGLDELGGQLLFYPEKHIYDVGGFPEILTKDFTRACIKQAMRKSPTICLGERVKKLEKREELWVLPTDNGSEHLSRAVILAMGAGAGSPKKLSVEYPPSFDGQSVFYSVREKEKLKGKKLLIVGGGDSAVDWANELTGFAGQITLIHRSDRFRAIPANVSLMEKNGVTIKAFWELRKILGSEKVDGAVIFNNKTKEEETLAVDCLLILIGFSVSLDLSDWGLTLDEKGSTIPVSGKMETNLPGVYACGDITSYEGKLKLIATGFGEAAIAVNFATTYLDPKARAFPGHSSNMG